MPHRVHGGHGPAKRHRTPQGKWELELLLIQSWGELAPPANEVLHQLAQIENNGWSNMKQPLLEWRKMRGLK